MFNTVINNQNAIPSQDILIKRQSKTKSTKISNQTSTDNFKDALIHEDNSPPKSQHGVQAHTEQQAIKGPKNYYFYYLY